MKIICLEEPAFYELMDRVYQRFATVEQWVDKKEAMKILKIKSSTTLQNLRDSDAIRYSQANERGTVIYHRQSLYDYLEHHTNIA